ncbi:hypothetical protein TD95_003284, partial [Thielaviopsis punctulata]
VHADATNFAEGLSKQEVLEQLVMENSGLLVDSRNWTFLCDTRTDICSNLANAASMIWHAYKSLPSPSNAVNWAGFYTIDPSVPSGKQLILGPFHGKVACQTIAFGRGVCGTAAATQKTQLVPDVHAFPGHIACDSVTKSEIVVPICVTKENGSKSIVGLIDLDCTELNGFDETDQKFLEQLAEQLAAACDW